MSDSEEQSFVAAIDAEAVALSTARDAARILPSSTSTSTSVPVSNRRPRINYTRTELMNLLRILERVVPVDSAEWQDVAEEHGASFPTRDVESLKKKFSQLHRRKAGTGNPNIPPEVQLAKEVHHLIGDKALIGTGDEIFDMNGGGTFTNENGVVRPHVSVPSVRTNASVASVAAADDGDSQGEANTPLASPDFNRRGGRGGRKPDALSLMLLHLKEEGANRALEREDRKIEREARAAERAADRTAMMEMVGAIAGRYFSDKKRKKRSSRKRRNRKKRRTRLGITDSDSPSSSSESSSDSSSSHMNDSDDSDNCGATGNAVTPRR